MRSGGLDRQITLMQPTASTDSYGQETESFSEYKKTFARIFQPGSREVIGTGKVSEIDKVFKIRYFSLIDETWQIVCDSETYEIVGRPKELGRQEYLEIMGKAQV